MLCCLMSLQHPSTFSPGPHQIAVDTDASHCNLLRSAWQNDNTAHGRMITQHTQAEHVRVFTINDAFELSDLQEACWSIIVELRICQAHAARPKMSVYLGVQMWLGMEHSLYQLG